MGCSRGRCSFQSNPTLVWGLIASLLIANFMLIVLNLPLIGLWVRLLHDPAAVALCRHPAVRDARYARIESRRSSSSACCSPSAFSATCSALFHFPIAPVIVGLILGPLAEANLRRALAIGGWDSFLESGIAIVLFAIAATALILPIVLRARGKGKVLEQLAADED